MIATETSVQTLKFYVNGKWEDASGAAHPVTNPASGEVIAQEAVKQGVITQAEGEKLAAAHDAVAKVVEVDDFAPEAISPIYKKPADVHSFFQELGEQRAAS